MDIQLHFTEQGQGDVLILLHGNGEDSTYFEHQLSAFSAHYRTICLDTRGHGQSPRGSAPFTLNQFVEDLKAFMDAQGIVRAHLLGFSDGGNIALLFALKYPEYVDRLVLNGANLNPWGVKISVQLPILLSYGLCSLVSLWDKKAVSKRELLALMVTQPKLRTTDLAALRLPTLVIAGTRDMIRTRHTLKVYHSIQGSTLAILEGDHFVANKNSTAFNNAVLSFLKQACEGNAQGTLSPENPCQRT